jgi:hypothetical protein
MKIKGSVVSIAMLAFSATVSAAEIWNHTFPTPGQLKWNGFESGSTAVNVGKTNAQTATYSGSGGQFRGYFYTDGAETADEFFRFFCLDLFETATAGPLTYQASIYGNDKLAQLFDIAYPNKALGDFYEGAATDFGKFGSDILSSAFQLAVWEIFYETANNFSMVGGTFKSNTAPDASGSAAQKAVAQADAWLDLIDAGQGSASGWTLYKFTNDGKQDYLTAIHRPLPRADIPVPEPGTLALLGLGIAALGALRRRKASR